MQHEINLIDEGSFKFDNLPDRPQKATNEDIASIINPIPQTVVNENNVVFGYYNTSAPAKFYADSSYTVEISGEDGFVYLARNTNKSYRWNGSTFVRIDYEDPQSYLYNFTDAEIRVGTFAGKALYRKKVTIGKNMPSSWGDVLAKSTIPNIDQAIMAWGSMTVNSSPVYVWFGIQLTSTNIRLYTGGMGGNLINYAYIWYTKTS